MPSKKRKLSSTNTTGYRGVYKKGERFVAQIAVNKKRTYLGTYDTPKEAAVACDRAVIEYNLPKDKLNWPDGYPKISPKKKKRKLSSANTTGYRGVTKSGERFVAQIVFNKKNTNLGTFDSPKEAAVAYDRAVIKYNLPKDRLNWPDGYPKISPKKKKRKLSSANTTGYRGVYKIRERFRAQTTLDKKSTNLGTYDTPKEAAVAYDRAVIKYNLPKNKLNFSNEKKTSGTSREDDEEEEEEENDNKYDQQQEPYWNTIIEPKKSTVEKEKEIVALEEQDDEEGEGFWV
jgi:hypothetical protein